MSCVCNRWAEAALTLIGLLATTLLLFPSLRPSPSDEPILEGRPIRFWVANLNTEHATQAQEVFRTHGCKSVPWLLNQLRLEGSAEAEIITALSLAGPSAVPRLLQAAHDRNDPVRHGAARALAAQASAPAVQAALPSLIGLLNDSQREIRLSALWIVGRVRPPPESVPALIQALRIRDADPDELEAVVRQKSADLLSRLGPAAEPALPALAEMLADPDPRIRQRAALAIWRIRREAALVVPALAGMLADPDLLTQDWAAIVLQEIRQETELPGDLLEKIDAVRARWAEKACQAERLCERTPEGNPAGAGISPEPE